MRSIDLSKSLNRLARALTSVSVRTRIVVLALVPVVGFLANGMTYVSGKRDVDGAFRSVGKSHALADASRDFKIAVDGMRIAVKDFTASPHGALVDIFEQSQNQANRSLDIIEASVSNMSGDDIKALRAELGVLKKNFDALVAEQRILGFSDIEGLRGGLVEA
ncbi:MAG: hypothetical protein WB463_16175, partial [Pseudolabrys sp.]